MPQKIMTIMQHKLNIYRTFAVTVPVLLPIRTACGSSYLYPFLTALPLTYKTICNG